MMIFSYNVITRIYDIHNLTGCINEYAEGVPIAHSLYIIGYSKEGDLY